ncbi:MAG: carotenoid oxygenase family protein [Acidimicrobiia bacterium]|nr:carotenoid oxygenase family protein [Acidimicrobiia bacterium]
MATTDEKTPFHLKGNYAPVTEEVSATDLAVVGTIPPELEGRYLRNGANPITGESQHWFFGDGMIHGVRLRGGKAEWYRNRYVRTPFVDDPDRSYIDLETGQSEKTDSKANTHVVAHGGRILCLEEGHVPYEITPELDTVGPHDFDGRLDGSFTAHPKLCPETGEMIGFGYGIFPPYLTYHRVSADGTLVQSEPIELPAPVMMHDFNVTTNHVVFMDLPVVFDLDLAIAGTMPFVFRRDNGARLGVMPRDGDNDSVRWFEIEPCYVFHPVNAFESADRIVLDVARYPQLWAEGTDFTDQATLWRWEIDLAAGAVNETQLDDRAIEFGRVSDDRVARPYRYGYAVGTGVGTDAAIVKYDLDTGGSAVHDFGAGRKPGEFVFAPADGASAEDDGYLLGYVYDEADDASSFVVLDAADPASDPVATVALPQRVPFGFHGSWIAD